MTDDVADDSHPLEDYQRRGYAVLRGFLSEADLGILRPDFEAARDAPVSFANAKNDKREQVANNAEDSTVFRISRQVLDTFSPRLLETARRLGEVSDTHVDTLVQSLYFATQDANFGEFHQDLVPSWLYQDPTQYLNVYVPIIKPDPAKSNLEVAPCDVVARALPSMAGSFFGRDAVASEFFPTKNGFFMSNLTFGTETCIDLDIRAVAVCPKLRAGDALLVRGDTFHKTQDVDTKRVAASFRLANGQARLTLQRFAIGSKAKLERTAEMPPYSAILSQLIRSGQPDVLVADALRSMAAGKASGDGPRVTPKEILERLLAEQRSRASS